MFVLVSLRDPERDVASYVSNAFEQPPRSWWNAFTRTFSMRDKRVMALSELERARVAVEHETRWTLYVRDPEGNRVALSHHPQPADTPG